MDPTASETEKNQAVNALLTDGDVTLRASDRDDTTLEVQTRVELSVIGTANHGCGPYGIAWQVNIGSASA